MTDKQKIIHNHLTCTCDQMYKIRKLTDPTCFLCEYETEIELMMDEYHQQQLDKPTLENLNEPQPTEY